MRATPSAATALLAGLVVLLAGAAAFCAKPAISDSKPVISIVIDDMGDRRPIGLDAVALPGPVAFAFLPHSPHAPELATLAHRNRKEVLLHLPMEAEHGNALGPGAVTASMNRIDLIRVVSRDLRSIPHVSGVNNHMGSLLTPRREIMGWLMDLLRVRGNLFFLDSRTTRQSVALDVARQRGVPSTSRDVFLDNVPEEAAVRRAFEQLVRIARRRGTALGIGHPQEATVAVLRELLPRLEASGVRLVPVKVLIARRSALPYPIVAGSQQRAGYRRAD